MTRLKTLIKELWKPVLDGFYEVSNLGQVRRIKLWSGKVVERYPIPHKTPDGYLRINVHINGKHGNRTIHSLVAEAFHGKRPSDMEVNHKNFDRTDNKWLNLEYVSHKDNVRSSFEAGRYTRTGDSNGRARLTSYKVVSLRSAFACKSCSAYEFVNYWAEKYRVSKSTIQNAIYKINWKSVA